MTLNCALTCHVPACQSALLRLCFCSISLDNQFLATVLKAHPMTYTRPPGSAHFILQQPFISMLPDFDLSVAGMYIYNMLYKSITPVLSVQEPKKGQGSSAVFIARNRFAVLDKGGNQIVVKNLSNEITKKCPSPCATTDAIFYAGTGTLLCRSDDKVCSTFMAVCRPGTKIQCSAARRA